MCPIDLGGIDPSVIDRLLRLLASTDVEECEIERGDLRISLKRTVDRLMATRPGESKNENLAAAEPNVITAPAVGVFYKSEDRSDVPAIEAGSPVKNGDVLGIVEVMGVPHPVHSTKEGVIESFLVEDGEPVEYGQPLVSFRA